MLHASIVDKDVHSAQLCIRFFDHLVNAFRISQVSSGGDHIDITFPQALRLLLRVQSTPSATHQRRCGKDVGAHTSHAVTTGTWHTSSFSALAIPCNTTLHPDRARLSIIARPMPVVLPVTSATRPCIVPKRKRKRQLVLERPRCFVNVRSFYPCINARD